MRIAITGASGFIGQALVQYFTACRHELVLIGRHKSSLARIFPDHKIFDYEDLDPAFEAVDAVVHLATRNSDSQSDLEAFKKDNIDLSLKLADHATRAGVKRFVFASTIRAIEPGRKDYYGTSKHAAETALSALHNLPLTILRFGKVLSQSPRGKLKLVNYLPTPLRAFALDLLTALKPTTRLDTALAAIENALNDEVFQTRLVTEQQRNSRSYHIVKRLIDLVGAMVLLLLTGWLIVLIALAIRFTDGGPVFFRQVRLGRNQQPFTLYKFRSMRTGTPQAGTHEVSANAVISIGGFLRRTKLDELPQMLNILQGSLSFVGPRPGLPLQEELRAEREKRHVYDALPGLTGLAQIQGIDMSEPKRLAEKDAEYLARRSILLDIKIALKTLPLGF